MSYTNKQFWTIEYIDMMTKNQQGKAILDNCLLWWCRTYVYNKDDWTAAMSPVLWYVTSVSYISLQLKSVLVTSVTMQSFKQKGKLFKWVEIGQCNPNF